MTLAYALAKQPIPSQLMWQLSKCVCHLWLAVNGPNAQVTPRSWAEVPSKPAKPSKSLSVPCPVNIPVLVREQVGCVAQVRQPHKQGTQQAMQHMASLLCACILDRQLLLTALLLLLL